MWSFLSSTVTALIVHHGVESPELVSQVLKSMAVNVLIATGAAAALKVIAAEHVDLVVSELGPGDGEGHALIRAVRALPDQAKAQVPALALELATAATPDSRAQALEAGFDAFMTQPWRRTDLEETTEVLLQLAKKSGD
jgi:CheY-like chemotaxis protein